MCLGVKIGLRDMIYTFDYRFYGFFTLERLEASSFVFNFLGENIKFHKHV